MSILRIAFGRAFSSLLQPRMWLSLVMPVLISLVIWILLTIFALQNFAGWLIDVPPFSWASTFVALGFAKFLAYIGGWALIFAIAYLTALILMSVFMMLSLALKDQPLRKTSSCYKSP